MIFTMLMKLAYIGNFCQMKPMPSQVKLVLVGKLSKERITILLCANMTGSEKLPLMVIGKFKKPRCFQGVNCLPVKYEANKNAWMTSTVFEEWIRKWDEKQKRRECKIVLFVDNCSAHLHVSNLDCIELLFLPPNTTTM